MNHTEEPSPRSSLFNPHKITAKQQTKEKESGMSFDDAELRAPVRRYSIVGVQRG